MEYTVRRLDPGSIFKVSFVLYGIVGLLIGFVYGLMFLFIGTLGAHSWGPGLGNLFRIGSGLGAILIFFLGIVFALVYALVAAAFVALGAVVYNLLASSVGGIKITLKAEAVGSFAAGPAPLPPYAAGPVPVPYQPFPPGAAPYQPYPPAGQEPPAGPPGPRPQAPPPTPPPAAPERSPYAPPDAPEDRGPRENP